MPASPALSPVVDDRSPSWIQVTVSAQAVAEFSALAASVADPAPAQPLWGLLFGSRTENGIAIATIRQLPAADAAYRIENINIRGLAELADAAKGDTSLERLEIVGWYRFHPQGHLELQPEELYFHERCFPYENQLGVIVKLEKADTLQVLACARSQDGTISRTQYSSTLMRFNRTRPGEASGTLKSGPIITDANYLKAYDVLESSGGSKRSWVTLWAVVAALLGALTGIVAMWSLNRSQPATEAGGGNTLSLLMNTSGAQLVVSWSGGLPSARQASLKILDGNEVRTIDLVKIYKPADSFTIPRHSGNLQAILSMSDGYRKWQSQSSLIDGFQSAAPRPEAAAANDAAELERLRTENQRLEAENAALRKKTAGRPRRTRR